MKQADKKALLEVVKSLGRFVWFGLLGVVVSALTLVSTNSFGGVIGFSIMGQYIDVAPFVAMLAGFTAKSLDVYIHNNKDIGMNGIAPGFLQR